MMTYIEFETLQSNCSNVVQSSISGREMCGKLFQEDDDCCASNCPLIDRSLEDDLK